MFQFYFFHYAQIIRSHLDRDFQLRRAAGVRGTYYGIGENYQAPGEACGVHADFRGGGLF